MIDELSLSALLVVGCDDVTGTSRGRFHYVTDFEALNGTWFVLLRREAPPVLFQPAYIGSAWADQAARIEDVVVAVDQATEIASTIRRMGAGDGRIGVAGWSDVISTKDASTLKAELPEVDIVDVTDRFDALMAPKSAEEIQYLEDTASMFKAAFAEVREALRPGVSERHVVARAFRVIKELGGTSGFLNVSRSGGITAFHPPTNELFEVGDLVGFDLEHRGPTHYGLEAACYFSIGPPASEVTEAYAVQREIFEAGIEHLRPGRAPSSVMAGMESVAARHGLSMAGPTGAGPVQFHGHGVGLNFFEPPLVPSGDSVVKTGSAVALHPWTAPETAGKVPLFCLDTVLVEDTCTQPLVFEGMNILEV